jgi:long-chain acyl-CoA synthetase
MDTTADILARLPRRISHRPLAWAKKTPNTPAVIEDGVTWTYGDLAKAVDEAKALLMGLGVRPGDRVLIINENCRAFVALLLACSELDAWAVTVNARLSSLEIDTIQAHCQPRRTFYTTEVSPEATAHGQRHGAEVREIGMLGTLGIGPLADVQEEKVYPESEKQVAAMIYTTGTTGNPKGVMLSHRNLLFISEATKDVRGLRQDDYVYVTLPLSHIFGLSSTLLSALYAGASLHLVPRFSPEHLFKTLEKGISVFQGVPAMHSGLLEYAQTNGIKIKAPRLRYLSCGGAPMDMDLKTRVEKTLNLPLNNGYGMSETSPTIAVPPHDAPRSDGAIGCAIPGIGLRFVDPATGEDVAEGDIGEMWVQGPSVMLGYYHNPEETARVINKDGWFNTGDLARREADGAIFIVGRSKELIIRSGFNVYPPELEGVINSHEDVRQSAVVGRKVPGNEEVIAFIQPIQGKTITEDMLKDWLKDRVAPYKKPSRIIVMEQLPAAPTGKPLKGKLAEMAENLD